MRTPTHTASHTAAVLLLRSLRWIGVTLLILILSGALFIAVFGWNWLRGPIERLALQTSGRVLAIHGDLTLTWAWPAPHLSAASVTFANPAWAQEAQMVTAQGVEVAIDVPQLLQRRVVFSEVRLHRAAVFLEQSSDGRKSWLLDTEQLDERARIRMGRLAVQQGTFGYDDVEQKTRIRVALSTPSTPAAGDAASALIFRAQGRYKGLLLNAHGSGGPLLALRDTSAPYPLKVDAQVGQTTFKLDGTVTNLLEFTAADLRMAVRGDNLEHLFTLTGLAFPSTRGYATQGHLLRADGVWRYDKFSGRIGASDIAGSLQVVTAAPRPLITADLSSNLLDLNDLGPMIGARPTAVAPAEPNPPKQSRVLPDLPFKTDRWNSVDAEVQWRVKTIRRAEALPVEDLLAHLSLRDAVLKLDPLNFGLAGGQLSGNIVLDGRSHPIQARAQIRARKVTLAKLWPTLELNQGSIGQVNGDVDLTGRGDSVGTMLATADGKVALVVAGGAISKLMMERAGLHLWEILALNLTGDRLITLRCAVADFDVKHGTMQASALVFDTQITTLIGTGNIDLGRETLNLTFNQRTKVTSPLALRSPIHIRGSFAQPKAGVDPRRVTLRAAGALALGLLNPTLALIPLIDAGPGQDSDCGRLVRDAQTPAPAPRGTPADRRQK